MCEPNINSKLAMLHQEQVVRDYYDRIFPPVTKYLVVRQSGRRHSPKPGTIVYECILMDLKVSSLDKHRYHAPYGYFTHHPQGDYPFFTLPMSYVRRIGAKRSSLIPKPRHANGVPIYYPQ